MKNYKNITCTDFVNLNVALNLHSYEENWSFIAEFIKKDTFCCSLNKKTQDTVLFKTAA